MDAIALLPAGLTAPADAKPASDAVPTDAFATVFATAMGDVPTPPVPEATMPIVPEPAVAAVVPATETPMVLPAEPNAIDPGASPLQVPVAVLPQVTEPESRTPEVLTADGAEQVPAETAMPNDPSSPADIVPGSETKEAVPKRASIRGKAQTELLTEGAHETPAPSLEAVATEKEAPTTAPNAPVAPLDRTSDESTDERSEEPTVAATVVPIVAPSVSPESAPRPAAKKEPGASADASAPRVEVLGTNAPKMTTAASSTPKASRKTGGPEYAQVADQAQAQTAFDPETVEAPDLPTGNVLLTATSTPDSTPKVAADALPLEGSVLSPALDRGAAPKVVEAAPMVLAAPVSKPLPSTNDALTVTVPNERVAKIVTDRSGAGIEAPAPKRVDAKTGDVKVEVGATAEDEAVVVETPSGGATQTDTAQGDAAQGEGAPSDGRPDASAPTFEAAPVARTAATERPEIGGDRPSVDRHLVVRQVADRIENLVAARPRDGVTIHLEPQDLGTVTLVVKGLSSALDVQVTASDDRVRQSLDASRPELAQALAPRGIELRELRVANSPANANGSSSAGTNPNSGGQSGAQQGQGRPQTPTPHFTARPSRGEPASPRAARRHGRGVDLLV